MSEIKLFVNRNEVIATDPDKTLLRFLREDLGLVGAKDGCSKGQCGTCTVIVNGKTTPSCMHKMGKLEGAQVETIEGLEQDGKLHPIQQAFLKLSAYQCGFCTPGMIMQAKWFLDQNPNPTRQEVREALKGHICRCTGYVKIIDAVMLAAEVLRGETTITLDEGGAMGANRIRTDGYAKVTGHPVYTDDFKLVKPLQGKMVWPKYPHANILKVDVEEAKKMPGVKAVATYDDVPGRKDFGQGMFTQQPVICGQKVRFVGDPVAVVYAETEAQALAAVEKVHVEYEPLPLVTDPEEAMKPESPKLYEEYENGNLLSHAHTHKGSVEYGFAISDVIVEDDYETQCIEHAYMEPDAALSEYDENGKLTVYGSVQNPLGLQRDICACLDLPEEKVRVVIRPNGGAFGGREEPSVHIQAALGTLMTGRPVRMVFSREEMNFFTTKRHAMRLHYKLGATKDGKIQAIQARTVGDTGAYASSGEFVLFRSCVFGAGCYAIPNAWMDSYAVYTNNVTAGSMRGFGSTQPAVPLETLVDRLGEKLGMDPFEIRRINGLSFGKQTITGHVIDYSCGFLECLDAVEKRLKEEGLPAPSGPHKKVGYGVAASMKNVGLGSGAPDHAWAQMKLDDDGKFLLMAGGVECGQGHDTVVVQIAAEMMGVSSNLIEIKIIDSDYTLDAGITTASRQTFVSGNACKAVAAHFREALITFAAETLGVSRGMLQMNDEGIYHITDASCRISFADLAKAAKAAGVTIHEKYHYNAPQTHPYHDCSDNFDNKMVENRLHFSYCFSAQAVVVEVDELTGKVKVLRVYAANDVGKAVNPALVEGQIEGGVAMGLGMALSENFIQKDAQVVTKDLASLKLPKTVDMPETLECLVIEEGHPYGPFGAKGMGELPLNATAPAILNAIYNAVGVRINKLPINSAELARKIQEKNG